MSAVHFSLCSLSRSGVFLSWTSAVLLVRFCSACSLVLSLLHRVVVFGQARVSAGFRSARRTRLRQSIFLRSLALAAVPLREDPFRRQKRRRSGLCSTRCGCSDSSPWSCAPSLYFLICSCSREAVTALAACTPPSFRCWVKDQGPDFHSLRGQPAPDLDLILLSEILVLWRLWVLLGLCCHSSFSFVRMVNGRPDAPLSAGLDFRCGFVFSSALVSRSCLHCVQHQVFR
jgi:hypothetical protein